jgi:Domain of unknown function (DUF5615)
LKLLIDEMYPPAIAEQLRDRGGDAQAVTERAELRSLGDGALFDLAQQEQRALVTENIADYALLADAYDRRTRPHHGLMFVSPGGCPRGSRRTIGRMVTALDRLLREHPGTSPTSLRHWL